jgi:hypothetical protein
VPAGLTAAEARREAESAANVRRHVAGRTVLRCVYVPDRLVNIATAGGVMRGVNCEPG